ncbi:LD-carboxypeptidase [Candidatus Trichorickettsia mobilis]|uniref:LD-carboxypeptidase n=1 Tax=Candidatus Trichorickettsia mobilis TaxID=1346319 RepID=UPI00292E08C4|nr:LD-carboxypeptidase [Candidatus Trichorickettsia mobilis]
MYSSYKALVFFVLLLITKVVFADFQQDNADFLRLLKNTPITIVAPASGTDDASLEKLRNISSLKLLLPNNCFDGSKSLFHAHTDQVRFECLKNALFDQSSQIVWCLRGGYGAAKIIPLLKRLKKPAKDKWLIGFSDITVLHIFLTQEWGWKTIHGNGIVEILNQDKRRTNFTKIAEIVSGKVKSVTIKGLLAINSLADEQKKHVKGVLTGGNLTIVETSIGTEWQIKTSNKILFLEDVGIKPYQLDRALTHLLQAGLLVEVKAIIFGACGNDDQNIMAALKDFAATVNIPIFKSNRFGHEQVNDPIIYNTETRIVTTKDGKFDLIIDLF